MKKSQAKVKAILDMKESDSMLDVRRFWGMIKNRHAQPGERSKPLRDRLRKDASWTWVKGHKTPLLPED